MPTTRPVRARRSSARRRTGTLEAALRSAVSGSLDFGPGARALYAADASNYRQVPLGVMVPETVDDVVAAVATCARHQAPLLCGGGRTAMAGQTANPATTSRRAVHLAEVLDAAIAAASENRGLG